MVLLHITITLNFNLNVYMFKGYCFPKEIILKIRN